MSPRLKRWDPSDDSLRLRRAVDFLGEKWGEAPSVAFVLGSGLGDFIDENVPERRAIPYQDIPNFPRSTVVGHAGKLTWGCSGGATFCALQGRVHFYEGVSMAEVVFAVRTLAFWGVDCFVITNAAGAINTHFQVGELMLITDHINLLGDNPLCGPNLDELGPRFPDMTRPYSPRLTALALQCGRELGIRMQEGVYLAMKGPSYETPAEIRMCRLLGADAVGMSTVPEVIALNHMGKEVLGISCLTNMAAGVQEERMRHEDVLETTRRVKNDFARLLLELLERMPCHG